MVQTEFKIGDYVKINNRSIAHQGRKGKIQYASGMQYWIRFDDGDKIESGFYPWMLEPAN